MRTTRWIVTVAATALSAGLVSTSCGDDDPSGSATGSGDGDDSGSGGSQGEGGGSAGPSSTGAGGSAPACSDSDPCDGGLTCCGATCVDTAADLDHCGGCDAPCAPPHAEGICAAGQCQMGSCVDGFADCNGNAADGCELNTTVDGPCSCTPGEVAPCYDGPIGTENTGPCVGGMHVCDADGSAWGSCTGQVTPVEEMCANGVDDDCNGVADDIGDVDGDGWTKCDGDCCEYPADCGQPVLVNPGAFDVAGNMLDDDCNGGVDDPPAACDAGLPSDSGQPVDYAKAIDLCVHTSETPALAQKTWGVISSSLTRTDGQGSPAAASRSIRTGFGSNVVPKQGSAIALLSTGHAAAQTAPNNTSPGFAAFQGGQDMDVTSGVPSDWLAANGGNFPNTPGCPEPQGGTVANDPVELRVRVRVPTNAKSFTVSTYFYSSEYPEWVCSPYNDFFLTLLDSQFVPGPNESPNPTDKNLAIYDPAPAGAPLYPVGVNLAFGNTGLFTQCKNGPTGCGGGSVPGSVSTCVDTAELVGTGFDVANPPSQFAADPGWCGESNLAGGGTGWLVTSGNVVPGETIEVRFDVWDTGDPWYDSVVLLDNFQWSVTASEPGTHQ